MLGFRGCRLSVVYPEITRMQVEPLLVPRRKLPNKVLKPDRKS